MSSTSYPRLIWPSIKRSGEGNLNLFGLESAFQIDFGLGNLEFGSRLVLMLRRHDLFPNSVTRCFEKKLPIFGKSTMLMIWATPVTLISHSILDKREMTVTQKLHNLGPQLSEVNLATNRLIWSRCISITGKRHITANRETSRYTAFVYCVDFSTGSMVHCS